MNNTYLCIIRTFNFFLEILKKKFSFIIRTYILGPAVAKCDQKWVLVLCLSDHHHHQQQQQQQHGYSWPSLAPPPYPPLLSADHQGYISYQHRAVVCRFELDVLPLLVHVQRSTGVHHSRARPHFPSSVPRV